MPTDKIALRRYIRQQKRTLTDAVLAAAERLLAERLADYEPFVEARTVLLYASLPDEVPTLALLASVAGKTVVLPRVVGDDLELRHYTARHDLVVSEPFGILEPVGPLLSDDASIDLALVPGLAFDGEGHRLGRGKGYYDRLFARPSLRDVRKVGLCFDFQYLETIPHEAHDRPMDDVIVIPTVL